MKTYIGKTKKRPAACRSKRLAALGMNATVTVRGGSVVPTSAQMPSEVAEARHAAWADNAKWAEKAANADQATEAAHAAKSDQATEATHAAKSDWSEESAVAHTLRTPNGNAIGFGGSGVWADEDPETGQGRVFCDTLYVRGGMTVTELYIEEVRSIGGVLVVSQAAGRVASCVDATDGAGPKLRVTLDCEAGKMQFVPGDFVRWSRWQGGTSGSPLRSGRALVVAVDWRASTIDICDVAPGSVRKTIETPPIEGDDLVLMGSQSPSRAGYIILTSEQGRPRIAVYAGVTNYHTTYNPVAVYGSLEGLTFDSEVLSGYGIMADNAYLHGRMILRSADPYYDGRTMEEVFAITAQAAYSPNLLLRGNPGDAQPGALTELSDDRGYRGYFRNTADGMSQYWRFSPSAVLEPGDYTLYVDVLPEGAVKLGVFVGSWSVSCYPAVTFTAADAGVRVQRTGTFTLTAEDIALMESDSTLIKGAVALFVDSDSMAAAGQTTLFRVALVRGRECARWTAAPEDYTDAAVASTEASLKVYADSIRSEVSAVMADMGKTVSTLEQTADSISLRVEQVESPAANLILNSGVVRRCATNDYIPDTLKDKAVFADSSEVWTVAKNFPRVRDDNEALTAPLAKGTTYTLYIDFNAVADQMVVFFDNWSIPGIVLSVGKDFVRGERTVVCRTFTLSVAGTGRMLFVQPRLLPSTVETELSKGTARTPLPCSASVYRMALVWGDSCPGWREAECEVQRGLERTGIDITLGRIDIKANNIHLEGLVTANGGFKILEDGSIEANNGTFAGIVTKKPTIITKDNIDEFCPIVRVEPGPQGVSRVYRNLNLPKTGALIYFQGDFGLGSNQAVYLTPPVLKAGESYLASEILEARKYLDQSIYLYNYSTDLTLLCMYFSSPDSTSWFSSALSPTWLWKMTSRLRANDGTEEIYWDFESMYTNPTSR